MKCWKLTIEYSNGKREYLCGDNVLVMLLLAQTRKNWCKGSKCYMKYVTIQKGVYHEQINNYGF